MNKKIEHYGYFEQKAQSNIIFEDSSDRFTHQKKYRQIFSSGTKVNE
jgi:hypothetical protein